MITAKLLRALPIGYEVSSTNDKIIGAIRTGESEWRCYVHTNIKKFDNPELAEAWIEEQRTI